jgi:hypothetical protein
MHQELGWVNDQTQARYAFALMYRVAHIARKNAIRNATTEMTICVMSSLLTHQAEDDTRDDPNGNRGSVLRHRLPS